MSMRVGVVLLVAVLLAGCWAQETPTAVPVPCEEEQLEWLNMFDAVIEECGGYEFLADVSGGGDLPCGKDLICEFFTLQIEYQTCALENTECFACEEIITALEQGIGIVCQGDVGPAEALGATVTAATAVVIGVSGGTAAGGAFMPAGGSGPGATAAGGAAASLPLLWTMISQMQFFTTTSQISGDFPVFYREMGASVSWTSGLFPMIKRGTTPSPDKEGMHEFAARLDMGPKDVFPSLVCSMVLLVSLVLVLGFLVVSAMRKDGNPKADETRDKIFSLALRLMLFPLGQLSLAAAYHFTQGDTLLSLALVLLFGVLWILPYVIFTFLRGNQPLVKEAHELNKNSDSMLKKLVKNATGCLPGKSNKVENIGGEAAEAEEEPSAGGSSGANDDAKRFKTRFGSLFLDFKEETWWFMSCVVAKTILLNSILGWSQGSGEAQIVFLLLIQLSYTGVIFKLQPFTGWKRSVITAKEVIELLNIFLLTPAAFGASESAIDGAAWAVIAIQMSAILAIAIFMLIILLPALYLMIRERSSSSQKGEEGAQAKDAAPSAGGGDSGNNDIPPIPAPSSHSPAPATSDQGPSSEAKPDDGSKLGEGESGEEIKSAEAQDDDAGNKEGENQPPVAPEEDPADEIKAAEAQDSENKSENPANVDGAAGEQNPADNLDVEQA